MHPGKRGVCEPGPTRNSQDFAEWPIESPFTSDDYDQEVGVDRNPNVRRRVVRVGVGENFDPQDVVWKPST